MIMRAGAVGLALAITIGCIPACTTTVPAQSEDLKRGLFMCPCGEVYMIIEQEDGIEIIQVQPGEREQRSTPVDPDDGGLVL